MADNNRIVFPDEFEEMKARANHMAEESVANKSNVSEVEALPDPPMIQSRYSPKDMANNDRIVYPDELEEIQAQILQNVEDGSAMGQGQGS